MSDGFKPAVGDRIVDKTFPPITRHTLALYCGASGDHNPIHVDIPSGPIDPEIADLNPPSAT